MKNSYEAYFFEFHKFDNNTVRHILSRNTHVDGDVVEVCKISAIIFKLVMFQQQILNLHSRNFDSKISFVVIW